MLNNDHITEFDVPEPYFYPCGAPKYQISSQAKPVDYEDSLGYKAILAKILSYNPELNPNTWINSLTRMMVRMILLSWMMLVKG